MIGFQQLALFHLSLYCGFHCTEKPCLIVKLLEKKKNIFTISASNFSSLYVRLAAVKNRNKIIVNSLVLRPIETQNNISNKKVKVYFVYSEGKWKICSFLEYYKKNY